MADTKEKQPKQEKQPGQEKQPKQAGAPGPAAKAKKQPKQRPEGEPREPGQPAGPPPEPAPRPRLLEHYEQRVRSKLAQQFGFKNPHQVPKLVKIVLNVGMGDLHQLRDLVRILEAELLRQL